MNETATNSIQIEACIFVAGESPTSRQALRNWRSLESQSGMADVHLTVVDVLVQPQEALNNRVLATPTLILAGPKRKLRYIGILDDGDYVLGLIDHCREDG